MTTTIVYADSTDGYLVSADASYTTARAGSGPAVFDGAANIIIGQSLSAGTYAVHEGFARWAYTAPTDEVVTGAAIRLHQNTTNGLSVSRDLEIREYAYASPLSAAAWRPGANLAAMNLLATVQGVQSANGLMYLAGSTALMDKITAGSSTISVVIHSSRTRTGTTPTGFEQVYLTASEGSGTVNDPALIFTSAPTSTLFGVLAAQVRLSDGSWAVLESDGAASPVVTLRRHTGSAATTVDTLPATLAAPIGAQGIGLAVDDSDNLYVVGRSASASNSLATVRYAKGAGWTWTAGSTVTSALPAYTGPISQAVVVWRSTGHLFVMAGHAPGSAIPGAAGADVSYAILSDSTLAAVSTAAAPGAILPQPSPQSAYFAAFTNATGSGLDSVADYVATAGKDGAYGDSVATGVGRYDLSGGALSGVATSTASSSYTRKDAGAKLRLVPTGITTVALVTADQDTGWGLTVVPYQATSSGWTALSGAISLDPEALASMPAPSALASSQAWDVVYLPTSNKLWIYYPDATDPRIIQRTGVDLTTYQATGEEVTVSTVGAAGGTNLAIRVARDADVTAGALLTVAHKASGGALSTVYVLDPYNLAPTEPTLTPRANFDATANATFAWTFSDPNLPADGQTAYQLQIINASTLAVVVDTGKVTSAVSSHTVVGGTLTNGVTYQWRVLTYDQSDVVSPWATYQSFSTGAGGSVTVTDPATDNPAGVITADYLVAWSVSGTTQDAYRVQVVRVDNSTTLSDTGWTTGTATTYLITGLLSDVEYEIRVTVRNAAMVESSVGTRRITPSYGTPDQPSISLTLVREGGYVLVGVVNPAPTGDRPVPVTNRIWRRVAGVGEYAAIGEVTAGDSYRDYTVASGVTYEYQGEAIAP